MKLSGYTYVLYGNRYDLPYKECILSCLPIVGEFVVQTDPRFDDGTMDDLNEMASVDSKIKVFAEEIDLNNPGVDGATKTLSRSHCTGDYLLQIDADEVLREEDYSKISRILLLMQNTDLDMVSCGVINWFCGNRLKLEDNGVLTGGWIKERISRNDSDIIHGIPSDCRKTHPDGRIYTDVTLSDGAGYVSKKTGARIGGQRSFCGTNIPDSILDRRQVWVHHYSWYNPARHWSMKPTWHYFWGLLNGDYIDLDDYHQRGNPDGELQNFWKPYSIMSDEDYTGDFLNEKNKATLINFDHPHPPIMEEWLNRHDERIDKWTSEWK